MAKRTLPAAARPHMFKPGNPGGPGRPKKRPISEAYLAWLHEPIPREKLQQLRAEGLKFKGVPTNADMVSISMGTQAIRGNVNAAKELREATEGKAPLRIEMSRDDQKSELVVVYATPVPGEPAPKILVAKPEQDISDEEAAIITLEEEKEDLE